VQTAALRFTVLFCAIAAKSASGAPIDITATVARTPILEGLDTSVDFHVINNTGLNLVLDYALAIINGPPDLEDNVFFTSVTFPARIFIGGTGDFIYGLTSVPDNPFDPPDNGLNHISFYLETSPSDGTVPQFFTDVGRGTFLHFLIGPGSTGQLVPQTLTDLNNCFNNPGAFPNPCPLGANEVLYTGGIRGTPFPTVADVTVVDLPEPRAGWLLGCGLALIAMGRRKLIR
jgi:hypothetical protein